MQDASCNAAATEPSSRVMVRLNRLSQQLSYGAHGLPQQHSECLQRVTEMMLNDEDLRNRVAMMVAEADPALEPKAETPQNSPSQPRTHPKVSPVSSQEFEEIFEEPFTQCDLQSSPQVPRPPLPTMAPRATPAPSLFDSIAAFFSSMYASVAQLLTGSVAEDPQGTEGRLRADADKVLQALSYVLAAGCMLVLVRRLDTSEARRVMRACVNVVQNIYHGAMM